MSELPDSPNKRPRWLVLCLSLLPLWLIVSAGVAVWWSFHSDDKEEQERNQRFAMEMSVKRIAEDMRKLVEVIGPRDADHPEALMRAAAMIDGTLGPSNTGYQTQRIPGPGEAPIIRATLTGKNKDAAPYWVIASYDTPGDPDFLSRSSSAVTALIAMAQAMARDEPEVTIHFLFYPCGSPSNSNCLKITETLMATMEHPKTVFYVEWMLHDGALLVFEKSQTQSPEIQALGELGTLSSACTLDVVGEIQVATNAPTLHVTTLKTDAMNEQNIPQNIAISAGKVVEWLRRCSNLAATK